MRPPHSDSEEALENATIELFSQLHWETANCYDENFGTNSTLRRETKGEVVLIPKLRTALHKLNPDIPTEAIQLAIEELTRDRSTLSLANANSQIYQLLKDGVKVSFKNDDGEDQTEQELRQRVQHELAQMSSELISCLTCYDFILEALFHEALFYASS